MIGLIKGLPRKVNMAGSPQPIVTFTSNVSGLYLPELIAYIQATQSGTGDPSPINPRAISGVSLVDATRTGKNLWSSGDISGTRVVQVTGLDIKAGTYAFSAVITSSDTDSDLNTITFMYVDGTTTFLRGTRGARYSDTITLTKDVNEIRLYASDTASHSTGDTFSFTDIQLEIGSTATTYAPYTGQTATINLGGTYYGGYLNVPTGLLTVTHGYVDLGSLTWDYNATRKYFKSNDISNIKTPTSGITPDFAISDIYVPQSATRIYNNAEDYNYTFAIFGAGYFGISNQDYTDAPTFKAAMSGHCVIYELATPQTVQLTPAQIEQLLGQNNVFCSSGDVAVTQIWARRDRSIISRG